MPRAICVSMESKLDSGFLFDAFFEPTPDQAWGGLSREKTLAALEFAIRAAREGSISGVRYAKGGISFGS